MFTLLFVCTGNMCRSAMAAVLATAELYRRLGPSGPYRVLSAGTRARDGHPMDANSAQALFEECRLNANGFAATELRPEHVQGADLVLTAERTHRRKVVDLEPLALKRAFTIAEFARVGPAVAMSLAPAADPLERARRLVGESARLRGTIRPNRPDDDDIADPIGRPLEVHRAACRQLATHLEHVVGALVGR